MVTGGEVNVHGGELYLDSGEVMVTGSTGLG